MKTILTFVGGGERDAVILQTALAAASPLAAHLDCLHAHVPAMQAARYARTEFASGAALGKALDRLKIDSDSCSGLAADNVRAFCAAAGIELCEAPGDPCGVTASFREEESNELDRLTLHASQRDLVVMGRARQKQGLAPDTLEHLVRHSGRPILVAASTAPPQLTETVMVCWKDPSSSAAAVAAATPFLARARRVVFVSIAKHDNGLTDAMGAIAREAGVVEPEISIVAPSRGGIPATLATAAEQCAADLVVLGAYGRSRAREIFFGSCTDLLLEGTDRPILLMH